MTTFETLIGTYTDGNSEGIYRSQMESDTGRLNNMELVAEIENPSYLATHPDLNVVYAVTEVADGGILAFEVDDALFEINRQVIGPADPCYCSVDPTGRYLFVAHYSGGAVSIIPIRNDGGLGKPTLTEHEGSSVHPARQTRPHPHSAVPGPDGEHLYVPDLGTDTVVVYRILFENGTLERRCAISVSAGAGPRHLEFGPTGRRAYLINEIDSTVSAFVRDPGTGMLEHIDTASTLPSGYTGDNITADIHVHPTGQWIYGSNRGHDSIAIFEATDDGIELIETEPTLGDWPRSFVLSPNGRFLLAANAHSDTIVTFAIDRDSGLLAPTGDKISVSHPVCITPIVRP